MGFTAEEQKGNQAGKAVPSRVHVTGETHGKKREGDHGRIKKKYRPVTKGQSSPLEKRILALFTRIVYSKDPTKEQLKLSEKQYKAALSNLLSYDPDYIRLLQGYLGLAETGKPDKDLVLRMAEKQRDLRIKPSDGHLDEVVFKAFKKDGLLLDPEEYFNGILYNESHVTRKNMEAIYKFFGLAQGREFRLLVSVAKRQKKLGLKIDGKLTPVTIKEFQKAGLKLGGSAGDKGQVLTISQQADAVDYYQDFPYDLVKFIQKHLGVKDDGHAYADFAEAVAGYQKHHKLGVNGKFDDATRTEFLKDGVILPAFISRSKADRYKRTKGRLFIPGKDKKGRKKEGAISYNDVTQGNIGDCFLAAALSAVAKAKPDVIKDAIKPIKGRAGAYNVKLYYPAKGNCSNAKTVKCKEVKIPVVDIFPHSYNSRPHISSTDSEKQGKNRLQELWPPIMEEAFARFFDRYAKRLNLNYMLNHEGYGKLDQGGYADLVFSILTGKIADEIDVTDRTKSKDPIWKKVKDTLAKGMPVAAGTRGVDNNPEKQLSDTLKVELYEVLVKHKVISGKNPPKREKTGKSTWMLPN